jgi:hypothetical protein
MVHAHIMGGTRRHTFEFADDVRFRHNILLMLENEVPALHWTLKSVWNMTRSVALEATDLLENGHSYVCIVQEEDNVNPEQLMQRSKTMRKHFDSVVCANEKFLSSPSVHQQKNSEIFEECLKAHRNGISCYNGYTFFASNKMTHVSTFLGLCSDVTVVVRRSMTPDVISVVCIKKDSTTALRITESHGDGQQTTRDMRSLNDLRGIVGCGSCYHDHKNNANRWAGSAWRAVNMFESYEGRFQITQKRNVEYAGEGRLCINVEWHHTNTSGVESSMMVYTSIHACFHGGLPHGQSDVWVSWEDGRGYHFNGCLTHGQHIDGGPPPVMTYRCAHHSDGTGGVVDHASKLSSFSHDRRNCWCEKMGSDQRRFDINAHLHWMLVQCRPSSTSL